jgi:hypothetical protein
MIDWLVDVMKFSCGMWSGRELQFWEICNRLFWLFNALDIVNLYTLQVCIFFCSLIDWLVDVVKFSDVECGLDKSFSFGKYITESCLDLSGVLLSHFWKFECFYGDIVSVVSFVMYTVFR